MRARNLDELQVYQKALRGASAVSALLNCPGLRSDYRLRGQLSDASDSTCSNISEGFGQSDRRFAQFLYYAKGSANEVRTRLVLARQKGHISDAQRAEPDGIFEEVLKMLTRLIQYLERSDRPLRGPTGPAEEITPDDLRGDEPTKDEAPPDDPQEE
jgi:four helix bundle protein